MTIFRILFLILLTCPSLLFGQVENETRYPVYKKLVAEIPFGKGEKIICLNDIYYNIQPKGVAGMVHDPDSPQFSNMLRLQLKNDSLIQRVSDTIYFQQFPNFHYLQQEVRQNIVLLINEPYSFAYIDSPTDDAEFYKFIFDDTNDFDLSIPVQLFTYDGKSTKAQSFIYFVHKTKSGIQIKKELIATSYI